MCAVLDAHCGLRGRGGRDGRSPFADGLGTAAEDENEQWRREHSRGTMETREPKHEAKQIYASRERDARHAPRVSTGGRKLIVQWHDRVATNLRGR